jgi:Zn-dependent peptidase ImmA (M78 family)
MARPTFPRREAVHAAVAGEVLARYAREVGTAVTLPVPIELIIEKIYRLQILSDEIDEPAGWMILGALAPSERLIVLNTRHQAMFDRWIGPERFTLAHELAHWIYDADDPDQLSFEHDPSATQVFCYQRDAVALSDNLRLLEMNANKLAANLLLPESLVRQIDIEWVLGNFRTVAAEWGVSQTTLRIRLETLGLIDDSDIFGLGFD